MTVSEGSGMPVPLPSAFITHEKDDPVVVCALNSTDAGSPFITVIMPVRNERLHIRETLEGLLIQQYPHDRLEVLVIDGDSTDGTSTIVREYAARDRRVRLLFNVSRVSSSARNIGVRAARGDIVVIVDGHCQFTSQNYLSNLAEAFIRSEADCLGRPQPLEVEGGSNLQQAIAVARASRLGHNPGSYIYSDEELFVPAHSVGVAYRRSVFEKIGLFDESFDACEDVEFNHRLDKAGLRCLLAPSIALCYHPRCTLRGLFRQLARYGTGRVRLARKHADTLSALTFAPAAFLAALFVSAPLSLIWPRLNGLFASVAGLYSAVVLVFSLGIAIQQRRPKLLCYLPIVFLCIHIGAGYGELREAVLGCLRRSWRIGEKETLLAKRTVDGLTSR